MRQAPSGRKKYTVKDDNYMKHDLKGYHHYHKAQMDNAEQVGNAPEQPAEQAAQEAQKELIYESGQEPGASPFLGDLNCELDMPDLLGSNAEQICKRCQELEDQHLRTLADMDNFKKRLTREKEEHARFAAEAVLADILPALDNLDLALSYGRNNEACADLLTGLDLAQKSLLETLARHGLTTGGEAGEPFNPEIHEALTQEPNSNIPAGHVSQLFQKGYCLKGRLLRPAKVIVSAG